MKLTTWDRIMIFNMIGQLQGDVRLVRKAGKILDAVEFRDEERKAINLRTVGDRAADSRDGGRLIWDDPERQWEIDLNDPDALALLRTHVQNHQWPASDYKRVDALFEALGIVIE